MIKPNKEGRYWVNISPYYYYLTVIEAWLKQRSLPQEMGSLLCEKLEERETERLEMLDFMAQRLKLTREELIAGIVDGTIAPKDD